MTLHLFLDTSALVKLFHVETGTPFMLDLVRMPSQDLWITDLARVEFLSALHRRYRHGELDEPSLDGAVAGFEGQLGRFQLLEVTPSLFREAAGRRDCPATSWPLVVEPRPGEPRLHGRGGRPVWGLLVPLGRPSPVGVSSM